MIILPGYQVLAQIYESSNSEVYRAIRETDNQKVILKVLKQDYPTSAELTRYKQEYELTRTLDIEGVIKAYELKKYQNTLVIILQDIDGESLKILMKDCCFYLPEFLSIAIKISTSLGQIHSANIIHKDINPSNLVYCPETTELKIIDFGISTRLTRENPTLKNPNILEGTLAYISPEQTGRMNRSLDYRTDFYSLGVTFYEMLTENLPFETDDDLELVHCHIAKQPLLPQEFNPSVPMQVSNIVMKLMAKNAEDRYQSAWGLKADLETCLNQLQQTGTVVSFTLGNKDISDKFQIPQKLYGREKEVETLLAAFERVSNPPQSAFAKRQGQSELMLIVGYSGIGKSALVQEIYKPVTEKRGYFIAGKFDQFQRNIPYSAIVNALKGLMQQLLTEGEVQLNLWRSKFLAALGVNGQVIIDVIPEVELIIDKQLPVPKLGPTASQNRFNFVFQKFINACCDREHPLVIFMDDLQWVDMATLKLIELMMTDTNSQYLFLIGAYRDNEVSIGHPLLIMLDKLRKSEVIINQITLANLEIGDIRRLIVDTLKSDISIIKLLADLVLNKTGGNPFFVNQFLNFLYAENLISFDYSKQKWQWDQAQIEAQNITDNVVELMIGKLKKLPDITQQILQLAACIGANFDLHTLSIIGERSLGEIFTNLITAVESGLILPLSQLDEQLLIQNYQFLHDRVQQAAYSLIPENQKPTTHLKIGQLLQQNSSEIQQEEKLFDIVGHLNLGIELITQPSEREALAQLNLEAGRKARNSTAYSGATIYLQTGIHLLDKDCWQGQYELTLNLYIAAAEAAYLNGDFDGMEDKAKRVLESARKILDKVKIYELKIAAHTAQGKLLEAIAVARDALRQLGVELPTEPDQAKIGKALENLASQLQSRRIEELVNLPIMTNSQTQAAMQLLGTLCVPIYQGIPGLLPLMSSTMVSLSLEFGNAPTSTVAYVLHGLVLCAFLGDVKTGYSFSKLGLYLLDLFNLREFKSLSLLMFGGFIQHRQEALRAAIPTLKKGYLAGIEIGDFLHSSYNLSVYFDANLFSGIELDNWEPELAAYRAALAQVKQYSAQTYLDIKQQMLQNLREVVSQPECLIGTTYDETVMLIKHHQNNELTLIAHTYIFKLLLAYFFGNYMAALENIAQVKPYLKAVSGLFLIIFHFYAALARLALFPRQPAIELTEILTQVEVHQTILHQWAQNAPMNYLHKWYLVEAEKYRVLGQYLEAIEHYDRAIFLAKENQFLNEEALANELAGKFYLNWGKEKISQTYLHEAHYAYTRWGALAKVKDLEQKYKQVLNLTSTTTRNKGVKITRTSTGSNPGATLDLATVMKASHAISGEIVLEQLLVTLMKIIIQNAGAQLGYLILANQERLVIEASGTIDSDRVTVLHSVPVENCHSLCQTMINYVARTKESIVLNDATKEGNFINDSYIKQHQPKSILCVPLINQGKLVSIIYLENNLTTGAFTAERVEILNLLSSQAAISIKNAKLYNKMTDLNRAYERFVPRQFLQLLEKSSIIDVQLGDQVQLEMSVLFSDIRDFTTLSEKMTPEDNFKFINSYLSRMESAIIENNGFIDKYIGDAIMALFSGEADNAVKAGIAMLERLIEYNKKRANYGYVPISIGIGINTGSLMLGTVGGQNRMDTTVISDAVNLASRVESLTKNYGVTLLITQQTYSRLLNPADYAIRTIDTVQVKGKSELVTVYEVFDADLPKIKEGKLATLPIFTEALSLYRDGNLAEARDLLAECLRQNKGDLVAQIYWERLSIARLRS